MLMVDPAPAKTKKPYSCLDQKESQTQDNLSSHSMPSAAS